MFSSLLGCASALALLSVASAQTFPANTNTGCTTASDVDYQATYYYDPNDTQDWGFYTQSQGTCDAGSYARVHVTDPAGNDFDCGYVALDGGLHLTSCANLPRGYMQEGQYTLYWETVPGVSQYSWNQFTVIHTQATITGAIPTTSLTTTPVTVLTSTIVTTPTETSLVPQVTITTYSSTQINTINITPTPTTITTTSITWYTLLNKKYASTTVTAVTTATCKRAGITKDLTGKRSAGSTKSTTTKNTRSSIFDFFWRRSLARRDDVPNTVGMPGQPLTTTIVPVAVIVTVTAETSTSTVTAFSTAPGVTITSTNPTPTVTLFSGVKVSTTTITLPQVTKSVVKAKLSLTIVTTTSTLTVTKKVVTTPVCAPSAL